MGVGGGVGGGGEGVPPALLGGFSKVTQLEVFCNLENAKQMGDIIFPWHGKVKNKWVSGKKIAWSVSIWTLT